MPSFVRFTRQRNRTTSDIFGNKFQERVKMELQGLCQKIAFHCKKHHSWQNRTGALEDSINFEQPVRKANTWEGAVIAGGWSKVKYSHDYTVRRTKGRQRKQWRRQRGQRFRLRRGMGVYVNYAYWVEKRGYPVLKHGVEKYKRQAAKILNPGLRVRRFAPV